MATICLHYDLMAEELAEIDMAMADCTHVEDLPDLAKELADLLYVVYDTSAAFGLDIDRVFAEVHSSNMSKLDADGKPIYREDGKVLKGPNYQSPNLGWVSQ